MAEITLADYTGYIFLEIIKAREMADRYSKEVAARYAEDEVLRHFSTPRFKIPKMELTIPVLISGAKFSQVIQFAMTLADFQKFIVGKAADVLRTVQLDDGGIVRRDDRVIDRSSRRNNAGFPWNPSDEVIGLVAEFHAALLSNSNPLQPGNIAKAMWARILETALTETGLMDGYKKQNPGDELFDRSLAEVTKFIVGNTVISRTTIENLLINPETNVVKDGSSESSVFTIRAELTEEGFFVKSVTDPKTNDVKKIVEFE